MIMKKALPRRTFLRGVGATLALPLLDAMVPAMTALAATPAAPVRRLGFVYIPMGSNFAQWAPAKTGAITELSPTLHSLTPFIDHLTILGNIENKNAYSPGNHATANSGFLSAAKAKMTEGSDYERSNWAKTGACLRSNSRWTCSPPWATATTASRAFIRTICRGPRPPRRCPPKPILAWSSSASSAMAAAMPIAWRN